MYSELVEQYSKDMFRLAQQYINGTLDDENYYNEVNYLLEEFEKKVQVGIKWIL